MARSYMTGFETGDATAGNTEFGGGTLTNFAFDLSTVNPGGSVRSGRFDSIGNILSPAGTLTNGALITRFYFQFTMAPTGFINLFEIRDATEATDGTLIFNVFGQLQVVDGNGATVAASSQVLLPGVWYLIDAYFSIGTQAIVWVDGVLQFTANGNFGTKVRDHISIGPSNRVPSGSVWFDDLAVNDNVGGVGDPNRIPTTDRRIGPGHIIMLVPDADITPNAWTINGGGSTHFGCLNELPGAVDDVNFLSSTSATSGLTDAWSFTNSTSGLLDVDLVNAIHFGFRGGGNGTQATGRELVFRASDSSGNVLTSPSKNFGVNGFLTVYPFLSVQLVMDATSTRLYKGYIDGVTGAVLDNNNSTRGVRCSTVWMTVDYQPAEVEMQPAHGMMYPIITQPG